MKKFFRFQLKTLLVVMAFVALSAGWFVDHQHQTREINDLKEHVRRGEKILSAIRSHPSWSTMQSSMQAPTKSSRGSRPRDFLQLD